MAHRVTVDKHVCISSGKCVADFPQAFEFDAQEIAETTPGADSLADDDMIAAARSCPSGAIQVLDESGAPIDIW
jgi:ferredoxin